MEKQLGSLISQHQLTSYQQKGNKIAGIVLFVMAGILLLAGFGFYFGLGDFIFLPLCLLPALLLAAIGYFYGFRGTARLGKLGIAAYQNGLIHTHKDGSQETILFDQVLSYWLVIWRNVAQGNDEYAFRFEMKDGAEIKFNHHHRLLTGMADLAGFVLQALHKRLMPTIQQAYDSGQTIQFGEFSLSQQGLHHKGNTLPWAELERKKWGNTDVRFYKQGQKKVWAQVHKNHIRNAGIFHELLRQRYGGQATTLSTFMIAHDPIHKEQFQRVRAEALSEPPRQMKNE